MLSIEKLNVSVGDKKILEDFNLKIGKGEVHAIMGPNGSGKSTLSYVLAGKDGYEVDGKIIFKNENMIGLPADARAQKGIFLAFQYPIEIPGVFMNNFLKTSLNAVKKAKGQKEVDVVEFLSLVKQHAKKLGIKDEQLGVDQYSALINKTTAQQRYNWQSDSFLDWAMESKVLRAQVYEFGQPVQKGPVTIDQQYINRTKPLLKKRLLMAGVRLAGCLNRLFDSTYFTPITADKNVCETGGHLE
jgi:energy-coupling factor transporter ATP-binding protein EcfA2